MGSGFQTQVYANQAPAVEGDFCDANPRYSVDAGPGGLIAGVSGLLVARFAWTTANPADGDGFPAAANNYGSGPVTGFVHREQQGLITHYLESASMLVPAGFPVTLMSGGGFWVKNNGATQALPGMKAYANFSDGKATFAVTGAPTSGATSSAASIAAGSFSLTGSITGNILTATVVGSGVVVPGAILAGTGVSTGNSIVSQISGTTGGAGSYYVSIPEQATAVETITGTYGTLTVGGTVAGTWFVGGAVTGASTGTIITALGTGSGGAGTYIVNNTQTVGTTALSLTATNVETKWTCMSSGLAGEIVKISSQPLG